jgi:hypothetical protein
MWCCAERSRDTLRESAEMYAGCVSGALQESEYLGIIHDLGFEQVSVQKRKPIIVPDDILSRHLSAKRSPHTRPAEQASSASRYRPHRAVRMRLCTTEGPGIDALACSGTVHDCLLRPPPSRMEVH